METEVTRQEIEDLLEKKLSQEVYDEAVDDASSVAIEVSQEQLDIDLDEDIIPLLEEGEKYLLLPIYGDDFDKRLDLSVVDSDDIAEFNAKGWPGYGAYYLADDIDEVKRVIEEHYKEVYALPSIESVRKSIADRIEENGIGEYDTLAEAVESEIDSFVECPPDGVNVDAKVGVVVTNAYWV